MKYLYALTFLTMASCSPTHEKVTVTSPPPTNGLDGYSINMHPVTPVTCSNGAAGQFLEFFRTDTLVTVNSMTVCNGLDGVPGHSLSLTPKVNGCVTITSTEPGVLPQEVCDGAVGPMGPVGLTGAVGPRGESGSDAVGAIGPAGLSACDLWKGGTCNSSDITTFLASLKGDTGPTGSPGSTTVINGFQPVKLCSGTASREYGIKVGNDLYAVYHDRTNNYAFLSLIAPGQYITTDQSDCRFQVNADGTTTYVSGGNSLVAVTPPALAGSCVVTKNGNNYTFTLTGVTFDNSASLTIQKSGALTVNSDNRGNWTITQTNPQWKALVTNTGVNPFTLYTTGNGNFTSAVIERLGQTLTCSGLPN